MEKPERADRTTRKQVHGNHPTTRDRCRPCHLRSDGRHGRDHKSKTAYITVGNPKANIYTPAVRIEIEGVDVTSRRIPSDGLVVGKSLDYPELLTFRSAGISFNIDNEDGAVSTTATPITSSSRTGYLPTDAGRRCWFGLGFLKANSCLCLLGRSQRSSHGSETPKPG